MFVKADRQRLRASGWAWRAASSPEAARAAKAAKGPQPVASSAQARAMSLATHHWLPGASGQLQVHSTIFCFLFFFLLLLLQSLVSALPPMQAVQVH